ncbi:alpha/beta-Hydrolase [Glarea lozoyensis ATCC 20868]|uniref:Alpha/beta-Hydrolase n=1 Tax=Glarea lozoyensis (strain ATCC 20868 / MF5171) TaxID=1116229 RepID=S3DYV2_GLAL2|nr:alpha/beta-Hydrolase [Glarea lozoyensis ATCC 20868]EPE37116.1 alpha/beta-Hydrolase [Glarea lozoyensis ATCC 20868]
MAAPFGQPVPKRKKEPHIYPEPFIGPPLATHAQTFILLHGRGSNGEKFGVEFLASKISDGKTIPELFPGMKFVFPTAKKRRARAYNRALVRQWFDGVPIDEQEGMSREEKEWQVEGLVESGRFLRGVVDGEVSCVGAKNVFLGGLSQGCAMGLHLLLSSGVVGEGGEDGLLGGFVGMSGWLPFYDEIQELVNPERNLDASEEDGDDDPFATSDNDDDFDFEQDTGPSSIASQVTDFVRQNMELPSLPHEIEPAFLKTPVFLGHGKGDEKVKIGLGRDVVGLGRGLGMDVRWVEYEEGHWYKVPDEIDDIVGFLRGVGV